MIKLLAVTRYISEIDKLLARISNLTASSNQPTLEAKKHEAIAHKRDNIVNKTTLIIWDD